MTIITCCIYTIYMMHIVRYIIPNVKQKKEVTSNGNGKVFFGEHLYPEPLCTRCHTEIDARDGYYSTPAGSFCLTCGNQILIPDTVHVLNAPLPSSTEAAHITNKQKNRRTRDHEHINL